MNNNVTAADIIQASIVKKRELKSDIMVYSPKEFQMNTAFSKAYIIETAGTKAGLTGTNLYIDEEFLKYLEFILTKDNNVFKIVIDNVESKPNKLGWYKSQFSHVNVKLEVHTEHKDNYLIWEVLELDLVTKKKKRLFKLWLNNTPVEFNQKGIQTKLYRAVKYIPYGEDDFILEIT